MKTSVALIVLLLLALSGCNSANQVSRVRPGSAFDANGNRIRYRFVLRDASPETLDLIRAKVAESDAAVAALEAAKR